MKLVAHQHSQQMLCNHFIFDDQLMSKVQATEDFCKQIARNDAIIFELNRHEIFIKILPNLCQSLVRHDKYVLCRRLWLLYPDFSVLVIMGNVCMEFNQPNISWLYSRPRQFAKRRSRLTFSIQNGIGVVAHFQSNPISPKCIRAYFSRGGVVSLCADCGYNHLYE